MKKPSFTLSNRTAPVFLLLLTLLGFGLLLPRLGFYWDDWAKILVARLWGLRAYFSYYAEDRPLSSWTHILFTPLLGQTPLPWHIFTLVLRWLSAWAMWWTLNGLWPRAQRQNLVAALFFLVYPVFVSQPAAVTFHQQWLQFFFFFVSLGAMVYAQRAHAQQAQLNAGAPRRFWLLTALALLTMLLQLSVTEYFAPLELVRPVALALLFAGRLASETAAGRPHWLAVAGRTLRAWAPYLAALAAFVVWRLFFIKLPGPDPYKATFLADFAANPAAAIGKVINVAFVDEWRILVESWTNLTRLQVVEVQPFTLLTYALAALAAAAIAVYLLHFRASTNADDSGEMDRGWLWGALILGLAAVLLGPVPAWITGRQVVFDFHSDRYAMPAMFGGALLVAALVEWLAARRVQRAVLAGVLVGLALILHLGVANDYRWLWTDETRFFWQLAWRAPGLKAPTALFTEEEPFANQGLFSTSAAVNLVYPQPVGWGAPADTVSSTEQLKAASGAGQHPQGEPNHLAYWFYTLRPRYANLPAGSDPTAQPIDLASAFRTLRFKGQTPNSLLLHEDAVHGNCLWVLSPRDANHPYLSDLVRKFLPISNLAQIEPQPLKAGFPPASILGAEPAGSWCYYFEKADLARQLGDWTQVTQLYDQAREHYRMSKSGSNSPYEWLPFIEGLGNSGRWDEAVDLTNQAMQRDAKYQPMLCTIWKEGFKRYDADAAAQSALTGMRQSLGCK